MGALVVVVPRASATTSAAAPTTFAASAATSGAATSGAATSGAATSDTVDSGAASDSAAATSMLLLEHVEHDASELRRIGVPVLVVEDHPHAVSAPWLETYARLAPSLARQLFDHLTAIRAVDSDGYLAYDPRGHEPEVVPSEIAQTLDATGARTLHEALYSAYAVHAIASASTPKVLDFWMKHAV